MFGNRLNIKATVSLLLVLCLLALALTKGETEVRIPKLRGYVIPWSVLDGGGKVEEAISASYRLKDAIGQSVIGKCEGASYKASLGFWSPWTKGGAVGIEEEFTESNEFPQVFSLSQNYPNPMGYRTNIKYSLPKSSWVRLKVYNIYGQLIKTLMNELQKTGYYTVEWDGRDNAGKEVSNGIYLYRLEAGSYTATRKVVMMK
ncbi:T9SS type A sorting domain-containing protein [candidate division WOR-3 bacterium]|nr:T9SS type A sorting domain-containing protein [candidate division WOR-3 bacterium]